MKNSKLVDIFKQGNLVVPMYFIKHFKDLKLELDEFLFLMYLYNIGNEFPFNPQKFSNSLNIDLASVMNYISNLSDKKYIRVEVKKNDKGLMEEVVILDDFFDKLSLITVEEVNNTPKSNDSNIFEVIEKEFGRTLSPIEFEIIKAWLESDYSEELIKEAVKEATFNGVSNLRYIDKILFEWGKSGIKNAKDVDAQRKKKNKKKEEVQDSSIDMDIVDWNWFDEDE